MSEGGTHVAVCESLLVHDVAVVARVAVEVEEKGLVLGPRGPQGVVVVQGEAWRGQQKKENRNDRKGKTQYSLHDATV